MQATQPTAPTMELSDPVFDDMAMSDMADRRKFLLCCLGSYLKLLKNPAAWSRIVFEDWKVFLSIMVQLGVLDMNDTNYARLARRARRIFESSLCEVDEDHRICTFWVTGHFGHDFPKGIHRLDRLKNLRVYGENMTFLPLRELNSLQNLERLEFWQASKLLSDSLCGLQETEKLHRVKTLLIRNVHSLQVLRVCPSVERLIPDFRNPGDVDAFLNLLGSIEIETLQSIEFLPRSKIDGEQLAKFMLEIVPRFPNLAKLQFFQCCTITDFQVLSDRLRSGQSRAISNSLRSLEIYPEIPYSGSTAQKEYMLNLLKFFPTIDCINLGCCSNEDFRTIHDWRCTDPDLRYAVIKNSVGRRVVRGGGSSRLPLSVWPIILHRAQRKGQQIHRELCILLRGESGASLAATGIYYLLRKGSALIGRRDLVGDPEQPPPSKRQKRA